MAGTVMHLVIADKLIDQLNIINPAQFYCGNLAPDAIMARQNYVREMKNHTHFKDGLKPYEFRYKDNQVEYFKRLNRFAEHFLNKDDPYYELYLGYIVHIVVDELYLTEFYEEFLVNLGKKGISPEDVVVCKDFTDDVDRVDWELVRKYKFKFMMPEILLSLTDYEIPGWITKMELEQSKKFIIDKNFYNKHSEEPLKVMTYEKNYEYMNLCIKSIPQILNHRFGI